MLLIHPLFWNMCIYMSVTVIQNLCLILTKLKYEFRLLWFLYFNGISTFVDVFRQLWFYFSSVYMRLLNGNYTRMLLVIWSNSWKQHPVQLLTSYLTNHSKRTRHARDVRTNSLITFSSPAHWSSGFNSKSHHT